jgi:hypothetical protein
MPLSSMDHVLECGREVAEFSHSAIMLRAQCLLTVTIAVVIVVTVTPCPVLLLLIVI